MRISKEGRVYGWVIPASLAATYVLYLAAGLVRYPEIRIPIYLLGVGALLVGATAIARASRRRWREEGLLPPRFSITLLWQKVAIILVLLCLTASNLTANSERFRFPESVSAAGFVAATVAFVEVSFLLFVGYRTGSSALSAPTHPGPLAWLLTPGDPGGNPGGNPAGNAGGRPGEPGEGETEGDSP